MTKPKDAVATHSTRMGVKEKEHSSWWRGIDFPVLLGAQAEMEALGMDIQCQSKESKYIIARGNQECVQS